MAKNIRLKDKNDVVGYPLTTTNRVINPVTGKTIKEDVDSFESRVVNAENAADRAAESATNAESKYNGILNAMLNLPDGSAVSAQVALNTQKVTELERQLIVGTKIGEALPIEIPEENIGKYVYATSGAISSLSAGAYVVIPVKMGDVFYISGYTSGNVGICLYKNGSTTRANYLEGFVLGKVIDSRVEITNEEADVMAISTRNYTTSPIIVKTEEDARFDAAENDNRISNIEASVADSVDTKYDAQLLDNRAYAEACKSGFRIEISSPKVVFIFDDGVANTSDVLDVFKVKGKVFCEATPSNTLNNIAKDGRTIKDVLLELQTLGGEVISHSINGTALDTMTYEECENALRKSRMDLQGAGFVVDGWVSPDNNYAPVAERLYPKYYLYGVGAAPSTSRLQNLRFARTTLTSLADAQSWVRWAVSNNSYRIFTSHMRDADLTNFSLTDLATLLDYCDEQGVEVITMRELFFKYGRSAE